MYPVDSQQELLATAIKLLEAVGKKEATGTPSIYYGHGPGGLFSNVSGEHPVLGAMVRPQGLLSVLPVIRADLHTNEYIDTVTGVTSETGTEPSVLCGTPITAGLTKLCSLTVPFGRVTRQAREWSVLKLGKRRDSFEDLAFSASFPTSFMQPDRLLPMGGAPIQGADIARQELGVRMFELATIFQRKLGPLAYTGNPANNSGEGYKEPTGLDLWINVNNKRDRISSAICTALNSLLLDFSYAKVDGTTRSIVQYVTMAYRWVRHNARTQGLDPATWAIALPPDLWYLLTDAWPCSYMSDRCSNTAGANVVVVNDERNIEMRNEMRRGSFLWIDGDQVPVVPDSFCPEDDWTENSNVKEGEYAADIRFVPLTVLGGMPVTGWQYFDQRVSVAENAITRDSRVWATDDGMYLWAASSAKALCFNMQATIEPRLLMHTPQLAARVQHVKYSPLQHMVDWDPAGKYFADGGVTSQPIQTFYNMWSSTPG